MDASISSATGEKLTMDNADNSQLPKGDARNLPKGWEVKKLGEVCEIVNGGTPKSKVENYWNGDIQWVTPKDLGKLNDRYINNTPRKISELGLRKSSAKLFPAKSVILSTRAPIGHLAINLVEMSTNQGCRGIVPKKDLFTEYLYFYLSNSIDFLNSLGTGATFRELSSNSLKSVQVPIPPLPEQKRIVAILDKAFNAIEKAKANAEQNLTNTKELFDSYLNRIFEKKGDDWEEKKLGEVFNIKSSKRVHKKDWKQEGIPFYRAREVVKLSGNGFVNNELFISPELYDDFTKDNGAPKTDDIIISAVGTLGKCYLVKPQDKFYIKDASVLWFKKKSDVYSPYIIYAFKSDLIMKQVMYKSMGATVGTLTISRAKNIEIPFPQLSKQKQIVQKLDQLQSETKKLEAIHQTKIADLEELKKSVLQKAFKGEL